MSATTKPPPTRNRPILPDEVPDGCELVDGKLRKLPMAAVSSWVGKLMYDRLLDYSRIRESVIAFPGETAFSCFSTKPTQVRKPDVSIIAGDSATFVPPLSGIFTVVPLIVVEVVSPRERASELADKVDDFRSAGTPLVWVIYPERRRAIVYRRDGTYSVLTDPAELSGEGVLPGLVIPLASVLPPMDASVAP